MSKGETMKLLRSGFCAVHESVAPQWGTDDANVCDRAGLMEVLGDPRAPCVIGQGAWLPGSDWFLFGGVAIQADPCLDEDCWDGVLGPDCNAPCPKCHGLGVIPQHGSIQRLPVHWSKTNEDGSFSGGFAEKRCVVVPIEGDE